MFQKGSHAGSAILPLLPLWLAAHAALLAVLLAMKFLITKTVLVAMLAMAGLAFLFVRFRVGPRKLSHSPVL
ncbi:MAG TPA: hypothetical protein VJS47_09280 [Rhizomicrobium sp.]|nr:hypothetical protein [Rhizomicrobium sp.]